MNPTIEHLISGLEQGRITRREAVAGLTSLLATAMSLPTVAAEPQASASSRKPEASTFQAVGLNHIALRVEEIDRSVEFYRRHLGLQVLQKGSRNCFMSCGGNQFVALFQSDRAQLDHYAYTVPDYDAAETVRRLRAAGLESRRRDDRVYFEDPDSHTVQLTGEWDDYPGPRPSADEPE